MIRARLAELQLAVILLSRLPAGRLPEDKINLGQTVWAYPIAGLLIGTGGALALGLSALLGLPPFAAALLCLVTLTFLTGALHEDGLADLADGFGGGREREKKLDIMRDSRIGSYGVTALILAYGLRACGIATLYAQGAHLAAAALIALAMASRAQIAIWQSLMPVARPDGMGHAATGVPKNALILALVYGALGLTLTGIYAPLIGLAVVLGGAAVAYLAKRQIGGQTGDVLGASQQASEILGWIALMSLL
ncbi:adenosylcobinamide-GDP ribazoletransferase [Thioclava sp. 'Guangxiensis']|uniref:adenosylcobinamide-GDP ribazoletransferase n=1 Tax=Thioclava sp. 'Guangxiensis' TaxID=3149044 RepID=UPI003877EC5A